MKKTKVELIVAKTNKLDGQGALFVTVDPQFADFMQDIFFELSRIVGHERIAVFPLPENSVKFYSIKVMQTESIQINVAPEIKGIGDING